MARPAGSATCARPSVDVSHVVGSLERFYGTLPMPPVDPFRFFTWDVLSTQAGAARRDAAFGALQRLRALTPDAMSRVAVRPFEDAVRLAGSHLEPRLSALRTAAQLFRRAPATTAQIRGPLRPAVRAAATLPRLGPGSLHRMLLFGGGHCVQPVDPDVSRFWQRFTGAAGGLHPRVVRRGIEAGLPPAPDAHRRAAVYLRHHALQTCTPDPHCSVCPLRTACRGRRPA